MTAPDREPFLEPTPREKGEEALISSLPLSCQTAAVSLHRCRASWPDRKDDRKSRAGEIKDYNISIVPLAPFPPGDLSVAENPPPCQSLAIAIEYLG
jgi:hypothetical protein